MANKKSSKQILRFPSSDYMTLAVIAALLITFFGVYVASISEGSRSERLLIQIMVIVIYSALGTGFAYLDPKLSWQWGLIISAPGLLVYAFLVAYDPLLLRDAWFAILFVALSILGAFLMGNYETRKKRASRSADKSQVKAVGKSKSRNRK